MPKELPENRPPPSSFVQSVPIRRADLAGIAARVPAPVSEKKPPPRMIFEDEDGMAIDVPRVTLPAADEPVMASAAVTLPPRVPLPKVVRRPQPVGDADSKWPTADLVARLVVTACRWTGDDPISLCEGNRVTRMPARVFVGRVLREEFPDLMIREIGGMLGVFNGSTATNFMARWVAEAACGGRQAVADLEAIVMPALALALESFL